MSGKAGINESVRTLLAQPELIGRAAGFRDLTAMHGEWIREMVYGTEDYTLQAHRGSYKSSCLAVAIALLMVIYPKRNIIFLRKTDDDVAEMMRMVGKILKSETLVRIVKSVYAGTELTLTTETTATPLALAAETATAPLALAAHLGARAFPSESESRRRRRRHLCESRQSHKAGDKHCHHCFHCCSFLLLVCWIHSLTGKYAKHRENQRQEV